MMVKDILSSLLAYSYNKIMAYFSFRENNYAINPWEICKWKTTFLFWGGWRHFCDVALGGIIYARLQPKQTRAEQPG